MINPVLNSPKYSFLLVFSGAILAYFYTERVLSHRIAVAVFSMAAHETLEMRLRGRRFPGITSGDILSHLEFIFPQNSLQFGFITSGSVYEAAPGLNSFPSLQPFSEHVWVGIAFASIAMAIISDRDPFFRLPHFLGCCLCLDVWCNESLVLTGPHANVQ